MPDFTPCRKAVNAPGVSGRVQRANLFALTYGSDVQWLKNIVAAGGCGMRIRGRDVRLIEPELIVDPDLRLMPLPLRIAGKLNRVTEFLRMRAA